jgi:hypothetical protein
MATGYFAGRFEVDGCIRGDSLANIVRKGAVALGIAAEASQPAVIN